MFGFTVAGVVAIAVAVPEGANPGSLISLLIAALPATVASVVAVSRLGEVKSKVTDLGNGVMDKKIEDGVHRAMDKRESRDPL